LKDGFLDTASLGESDLRVVSRSDDKNISLTGCEGVSLLVLDSNDVEGSIMPLKVDKLSNASSIVSLGYHDHGSHFELVDIRHLSCGDVDLNSIVDLDIRVRVTKGASVVGNGNRDLLGCDIHLLDATKLVLGLVLLNTVKHEASLGVEQKTEAIAGLLKLDNVHESSRVVEVSSDLAVNLDATLHADLLAFLSGQGVLETLTEDDSDGKALALLVRTGGGLGCPYAGHFAKVPMARRIEALEVLLGSARHDVDLDLRRDERK